MNMQKGKYVFVARQDGSYRYCRNSDWMSFLSGQIPASCLVPVANNAAPSHSSSGAKKISSQKTRSINKLIAFEVEIKSAIYSKKRITCVDNGGFYSRSRIIELPSTPLKELISTDKDAASNIDHAVLENYIDQLLYLDTVPVLGIAAQLEKAPHSKTVSTSKVVQTHLQCA
jgi:hypothetical protein